MGQSTLVQEGKASVYKPYRGKMRLGKEPVLDREKFFTLMTGEEKKRSRKRIRRSKKGFGK